MLSRNTTSKLLVGLILLLTAAPLAWAVTIHDIQYTTDPSGASPLAGTSQTVSGIVTAVIHTGGSNDNRFWLQDGSGPWNGVYIYEKNYPLSVGDSVTITGSVVEYQGSTEIQYLTGAPIVHKQNCRLADPAVVTCAMMTAAFPVGESYEGVYVSMRNVHVTSGGTTWSVNDGTGYASVSNFVSPISALGYTPTAGDSLMEVRGVIEYYNAFITLPRGQTDVITFRPTKVIGTTPAASAVNVPINTSFSINFGKVMNPASMIPANFSITGVRSGNIPVTVSYGVNVTNYTCILTPSRLPAQNDTITVWASHTITDTTGQTLDGNGDGVASNTAADDYTFTFTTALDTIKPVLTGNTPTNLQPRVSINPTITVNFSEAIDSASADTSSVVITGRKVAAYTFNPIHFNTAHTTATFSIYNDFQYGDTITVRLKPPLRDLAGNAIRDTSFTFYVRPTARLGIFDIQYTTDPSGNSPYNTQTVTVTGVVTAVVANGGSSNGAYFLQDGPGPWNGIYVYGRNDGAYVGDSATVTGAVSEYYGLTEISSAGYTLIKSGCALPAPAVISTSDLAGSSTGEQYEGVLVTTNHVSVTGVSSNAQYLGFTVSDGSGDAWVDDYATLFATIGYTPFTGDNLVKVTGVVSFIRTSGASSIYQILVRKPNDIISYRSPVICSTVPAAGNTNVASIGKVPIQLSFNKAMDQSTLIASNFGITQNNINDIPFSLSYDTTSLTCYLTPVHSYPASCSVFVWVSHSLKDTTGKYLDGNKDTLGLNNSTDDVNFKFFTVFDCIRIKDAQQPGPNGYNALRAGQTVKVQGIVTGPASVFTSSTASTGSWYIQDSTVGINVYGVYKSNPNLNIGQIAVVQGTVTEYNGVTEVTTTDTAVHFWGFNDSLPAPRAFVYNQFPTELFEGLLVQVDGKISSPPSYAGGGYNMEMRNGDAAIAIRFAETGGFPIADMTMGRTIRVIGILSQYDKYPPYDAGYQIVTRFSKPYTYRGISYPADIQLLSDSVAAGTSWEITSAEPNPFSPDQNELAKIIVNGPVADHVTLRVYDLKGRLVRTLLNNVPGGNNPCYWDGTDEQHRRANLGIYILHMRGITPNGQTTDKTKLIVLGTNLK
jgi:predicted extracellular nuclease